MTRRKPKVTPELLAHRESNPLELLLKFLPSEDRERLEAKITQAETTDQPDQLAELIQQGQFDWLDFGEPDIVLLVVRKRLKEYGLSLQQWQTAYLRYLFDVQFNPKRKERLRKEDVIPAMDGVTIDSIPLLDGNDNFTLLGQRYCEALCQRFKRIWAIDTIKVGDVYDIIRNLPRSEQALLRMRLTKAIFSETAELLIALKSLPFIVNFFDNTSDYYICESKVEIRVIF